MSADGTRSGAEYGARPSDGPISVYRYAFERRFAAVPYGAGCLGAVAWTHETLVSEGVLTAGTLPPLFWPSLWALVAALVLQDLVLHAGRLEVYTDRLVHRRLFGHSSRTVRLDSPCRLRESLPWWPWWTTAWRMQITGTPDGITLTSDLKNYWRFRSELRALCPRLSIST